uniref:Sugar phosphate transporter domain-containing protein n=1 Tax=Alexandrium catenella TaxID=2925 RepID=A0A7S1WSW5_ALECA
MLGAPAPPAAGSRHGTLAAAAAPALLAAAAAAARRAGVQRAAGAAAEETKDGGALLQVALFVAYFFAQSGMSFYMKWILSKVRVSKDLVGIPASFWVTSCQQLAGFLLVLGFIVGSTLIGKGYRPKQLASRKELLLVLLLSCSFSMNIGLNLLSLVLIPLSLTFIIRSCLPLSTAISQTLIQGKSQDISLGEWGCMVFGVVCACVVVVAQSGGAAGSASPTFYFGVAMAVCSIFCGAFDMVFKSVLGTNVKLSPVDTIFYMSLPVVCLTGLIGTIPKPVSPSWAAQFGSRMSDLEVFKKLFELNPTVLGLVFASGCLAFCYNVFTTFLVVKLSPATTSFAGNFNKAATVTLSLIFLEGQLPPGIRGKALIAAIAGNIGAFALYNKLKSRRQTAGK